jgi:hypothetical protein
VQVISKQDHREPAIMKPRLRFVVSQVGLKTGKKTSLEMLLDKSDLVDDGWRMLDERTWRTGISEPNSERSTRAREIGSITAWRSFSRTNPDQAIWAQVVPFSSTGDAAMAVTDANASLLPSLRQKVTITSEKAIDVVSIEGIDDPWVFEQHTTTAHGPSCTKIVGGRIEQIVILIACSGTDEGWLWPDVYAVVSSQTEKVRRYLDRGVGPL